MLDKCLIDLKKKNFLNDIMFMKLKRNDECEFT